MNRDMIRDNLITRKGFAPPYRLAQLYDAKGDLSKRWEIHFWIYNEDSNSLVRRKKTIPVSAYTTARERKAYAAPIIREINQFLVEGYFIPSAKKSHILIKVPEAVDIYVEAKRKSARSYKDYKTILQVIFKPYAETTFKSRVLADIKPNDIVKYLDVIQSDRGISNRTRNQYRAFLSGFFQYWFQRGAIEINPIKNVKIEKEEQTKKFLPFSNAQVDQLRPFLKERDPQLYLAISFIYYTFIRPKELRLLKIGWIEMENNKILVPAEVSKNKHSQYVSIPPALEAIIEEFKVMSFPKEYFLLGKSGKPDSIKLGMHFMRNHHKALLQELNYSGNHTLYSWKHTGACNLYKATKDIKLVQRQCRHTDVQTTDRYLRDLGMYVENDRVEFN